MEPPANDPPNPSSLPAQSGPLQSGLAQLLGLRFVSISKDEVSAELTVTPEHHQPAGIVHGGVYCSMVETVCSVAAWLHVAEHGLLVVGLDNHTSFLKATRAGTLRATARPLAIGRRTQLWQADIRDQQGTLVATGRVRLIGLEPGAKLAGETLPGSRGGP